MSRRLPSQGAGARRPRVRPPRPPLPLADRHAIELRRARDAAALALERAEALAELRSRALALAARLAATGGALDLDALLEADGTEHGRAEVRALILRGLPEEP